MPNPDPLIKVWKSWKKTGSEDQLEEIFKGLRPTIASHTRRYLASGLPPTAIDIEAKSIAVNALKSFDPNRGVLLKTYVSSVLPGLKRFVDSYQKVGRIPEYKSTAAGSLSKALGSLRSYLDREPSVQETAEWLGWPESQVVQTLPFVRRDLPSSGFEISVPLFDAPWQDKSLERFHLIYRSSNPQEQVAMESFLGLHGKDAISERKASQVSGLPLSKIKKLKNKIYQQMKGVKWQALS